MYNAYVEFEKSINDIKSVYGDYHFFNYLKQYANDNDYCMIENEHEDDYNE